MTPQLAEQLRADWNETVRALDAVLGERPGEHLPEISCALRSLVTARDRLLMARRKGELSSEGTRHLHQINSMMSVVVSLEYPLAGLHWQRVKLVRDGLAQMLDPEN